MQRLKSLAVPPAYENVWISPHENGHLQATGVDARGRKQYRYHPVWTSLHAETKFSSLVDFAEALPRIRRKIRRDLSLQPGAERFALAAAVAMIDRLSLRVGNPTYARENGSYGAITLKQKHLRLRNGVLHVAFTGKGGKSVRRQLAEGRLMKVLAQIKDLPGAELLGLIDSDDQPRCISSARLNAYLAEAGKMDGLTVKTFRTWAGTVAAFGVAVDADAPTIKAMAEAAAERLHITATVARNSYIHPDVLALSTSPTDLCTPCNHPRLNGVGTAPGCLVAALIQSRCNDSKRPAPR
ncbi:DNA topoisomerase IB [Pseudorhodobacter turbinis]|uniref:DNA topoisomerase IB n=1 Tax=Pseudorhodobacter turbinis TaxID=2500533 RepID=UPI001F100FD6|nr:DNA topoisomerase IB [Pseudorhodobacter turbinis]